jgi:uncharacterized sporulation protein YeaH/YhbH (DUF444 family)/spore cortex formation protein SpoVR/YcgB (stage V sporulation)
MRINLLRLTFFLVLCGNAAPTNAAPLHTHDRKPISCEAVLTDIVRVVPSGREGETTLAQLQSAIKSFFEPNGLFQRLGISRPYQVIQFLPGGDLNTLGSVNGMPIAHYTDGAKVSGARSGLLYEIVISGTDEHFSFYRDDNEFYEQLSIAFHALAGHNHFSERSRFPHFRSANRIQEAYDLSMYMDQMRTIHGADEVSDWYQKLLSLSWAQDVLNAQYQTPEDLAEKPADPDPRKHKANFGFQPTANILQAFAGNLPQNMPDWKKQMVQRYERLQRYIPGAIQTKIMNEGYATLMQTLLPKHTEYNNFDQAAIPYCCLLRGVVSPEIQNPYWLGLEAWRNIYAKFLKRPAIALLTTWEEKDRAFIKYADEEIIGVMDDRQFLKLGLDANWIEKNNFAITRAWTEKEVQDQRGNLPPNPNQDPKKNWPFAILSRNADEVVDAIISQVKSFQFQFPRVVLKSLNHEGSGQLLLDVSDQIGREVALDRNSIVQTLWVMSQIMDRPAALESTFEIEKIDLDTYGKWLTPEIMEMYRQWLTDEQIYERFGIPFTVEKVRVKVVVAPSGKVDVYRVKRDGSSSPDKLPLHEMFADKRAKPPTEEREEDIRVELEAYLAAFQEQLNLGMQADAEGDAYGKLHIIKSLNAIVDSMASSVSPHLQLSVPTIPRAMIEFNNYVSRRMGAALKQAIRGRGSMVRRPNSVKLKVLPDIPYFRFDSKSLNRAADKSPRYRLPRSTVATQAMNSFTSETLFRPIDLVDVSPTPGKNGDIIWGPKPKNGNGDGQGDEPGGDEPSEEGGDIQYTDIDLPTYASALEEEVSLPNLRPKQGLDMTREEDISGRAKRINGQPITSAILRNAFRRGFPIKSYANKDEEEDENDKHDGIGIIRRGLSKLEKSRDWVVRNYAPVKSPDLNAVVILQMDGSGSMDRYKKVAKQIQFDLRAILLPKYKNITFRFVVFNDKAYVFDNFEDVMRFKPNGGTRYKTSFQKTIELYKEYPQAKFDRFPVLIGDMDESFGREEEESFTEMKEQSQFTTIFRTNTYGPNPSWDALTRYFEKQAAEDEFVGYVDVTPPESYAPIIFRQAFKNDK